MILVRIGRPTDSYAYVIWSRQTKSRLLEFWREVWASGAQNLDSFASGFGKLANMFDSAENLFESFNDSSDIQNFT